MRGDLVIGLDSSTTATKAIAFDRRGRIVAEGRAPVPLSTPHPGWFEQEVSDWTGAAATALKQLTRKIDAGRVAGLAISNQRESFAQFDNKDRALRPGTLWLDERAQTEVSDLCAELAAGARAGLEARVKDGLARLREAAMHMSAAEALLAGILPAPAAASEDIGTSIAETLHLVTRAVALGQRQGERFDDAQPARRQSPGRGI